MIQNGAVFQLPTKAHAYIETITARCRDLIDQQIWQGIHISNLNRWMTNFVTDEERYFAACVLDSLIYRSENQTIALIKQLYQRILPDLSRQAIPPVGKDIDWLNILNRAEKNDPKVRLIPVRTSDDSPAKSTHQVLRLMKRNLGIEEQWMVSASEIPDCINKGVRTFIFIDDFLGTGVQFEEFFLTEQLNVYRNNVYMAYLPLAGHETGIAHLNTIFPELHVKPVERLDKSHGLFSSEGQCFKDGTNSSECAKIFYYELLKKKQIQIAGPSRRGYGCLELAYFFSHAAPDNCLPILWWDKTTSWKPLFNR